MNTLKCGPNSQERRFGFHVRPLVDKKQAGVVQGICQKEGFTGKRTNQSLRVKAAARILMKHCRTILVAVRKCKRLKDSLHIEVSSIVLGQNDSVDNIY